MRINLLVTGINGFVGKNLRPYLANNFDIHCISRKGKIGGFTYAQFLNETIGYDALVHLAGKAHDLKKTTEDSQYYEVNYELTKRLFDRFLASEAKTFIFISSVKAVADTVEGVLTEEVVPSPVTAYGKSKILAEEYILAHLPKDKKVYILRPCMIHGPGNKGNLNLLYKLVSKGLPWPLGAFENKRSFCSIDNLKFIFKELIERNDIPSGVYNIADDEPLSIIEVISILAESQNRKPKIWQVSKGLIQTAAKIGNVLKLPLNEERLHKLTDSYVVCNQKIKTAIGKPLPVSSRAGLLKTFQSFQ
jgi:nucleoside-diphosphate-sugar epimerase